MAFRVPDRARVAAAMLVMAALAVVGWALRRPGWRAGDALVSQSYDTLHAMDSGRVASLTGSPVVVIYLDLHSFLAEKQDPARPWPRELHARLVRRLAAAGARAIVFDIVFGGPGPDPAADAAFADAIRDSGRVILAGQASGEASQQTDPTRAGVRVLQVEPPDPVLSRGAAGWGVANHIVEDDFVVRRYLAGFTAQVQPSLSWAAAGWLGLGVSRGGQRAVAAANDLWLRYYGPALTVPHVSYTQALQPGGTPEDFFRDRIVFIGARPMAEVFQGRQDEFRSPYHSWDHKSRFVPGVEIHATGLLNLIRGDGLRRLSPGAESAILVAIAVLFGGGLMWLRPVPASWAAVAGAGLVLGSSIAGFGRGTWFPWIIPAALQIPAALFASWLFHFREWYATRRRLEAARRADEARIREQAALIEKATDSILVHDLDGRVTYANPAAERLSGWSLAELRSDGAAGLEADGAAFARARAAALAAGEWQGELRLRNRAGALRTLESRWTLIRDDAGRPRSLLAIHADVTEKRQLEAEAHQLQRREAIGALASGMAHDLNNALAPVLMGAQLLRREATGANTRHILQLMESGTRRAADMVRQVVLFARGRPGDFEALDLRVSLREMEKLVRDTFPRNITLGVIAAGDLWAIRGNPTELHQVLLNLCVNARDAMPGGGTLDLALDNVTVDDAAAAAVPGGRPGDFVSLLVSDSGTGIPAEVLPRIFEPFFTTKPEGAGTGLGLSSTARIVKSHGGFLSVTSEPGQGTTFEVFLPRLAGDAGLGAEEGEPGPMPRGAGETLLVVDDDQAVAEVLRRGLEDHGYQVLVAANGAEAVTVFEARRGGIAAVICDVSMPGLDGPATRAAIRGKAPGIPFILMSGGTERGELPGGACDPEAWLSKPVSLPMLLTRVRAQISTHCPGTGTG